MIYQLQAFLGNERIKSLLINQMTASSLSHAYLLEGDVGMGKKTLATLICMMLCCEAQSRPCGTCNHCRKLKGHLTPDIITLAPPPDKKQITIDQIRALREEAFLTASELPIKAFIIDSADAMNPQAQNALLKVLEEPPSGVYFFLLTANLSTLLPTVRSRTQHLKLEGLPPALLEQAIKEETPEARRMAAQQPEAFDDMLKHCDGSLGKLKAAFTSRKQEFDASSLAVEYLTRLDADSHAAFQIFACSLCKDRNQLSLLISALLTAIRDMLLRKRVPSAPCLLFKDSDTCDDLAARYTLSALYSLQDCFRSVQNDLQSNVNLATARLLMAEQARILRTL